MNMVACGVRVEACKICGHSRHIGHLSPRSYSVSGALFTITSVAAPGSAQLCVPLGPGNRDTGPRTLRAQPSVVLDVLSCFYCTYYRYSTSTVPTPQSTQAHSRFRLH